MIKKIFLIIFFVSAVLTNVVSAQLQGPLPINVRGLPEAVQKTFQSTVRIEDGRGQGTGVIVGDGTYVLTAAHNLEPLMDSGGDSWTITTIDGKKYKAYVVRYGNNTPVISVNGDTALLKLVGVKSGELNPAPIAQQKPKDKDRVYSCTAGHDGNLDFHVCEPQNEPRYFIGNSTESSQVRDHTGKLRSVPIICDSVTGNCFSGTSGGPFINERGEIVGLASSGLREGGTKSLGSITTLESVQLVMKYAKPTVSPPIRPPVVSAPAPNLESSKIIIYCENSTEGREKCRELGKGIINSLGKDFSIVAKYAPSPELVGKVKFNGEVMTVGELLKLCDPANSEQDIIVPPPTSSLKKTVINLEDYRNSQPGNYQLATDSTSPGSSAHERVHGVNAIGRRVLGNGTGTALQVGFDEKGNPVVVYIEEPKGTISQANNYMPNFIKVSGSGWETYVRKNIESSDPNKWTEITYLFDEQSAYIIGSNAYLKNKDASLYLSLERTSEFAIIAMSASSFIKDSDPSYFENSNFKSLLKLQIERSMDVIGRGLQAETNIPSDQVRIARINSIMNRMQTSPEMKKTRQLMIDTYGKEWTGRVLGFTNP